MEYDEDLLENGFFKALTRRHAKLYARAQDKRLIICVPKAASTDVAKLKQDDFEAHILGPTADPTVLETVSGKVCALSCWPVVDAHILGTAARCDNTYCPWLPLASQTVLADGAAFTTSAGFPTERHVRRGVVISQPQWPVAPRLFFPLVLGFLASRSFMRTCTETATSRPCPCRDSHTCTCGSRQRSSLKNPSTTRAMNLIA